MRIPTDINLATWIRKLLKDKEVIKFYKTDDWKETRKEVLEDFHNECFKCMQKGKYTKAECVHHVNHLRHRPDLALSKYYIDNQGNKKRNLIPLCNPCHNEEHPEKFRKLHKDKFKNEERW